MQAIVSTHVIIPIKELNVALPFGVLSQINVLIFNITVTQKTIRKSSFFDLCRNFCWAIMAPGHPPNSDKKCRVLSGVRQSPF